MIRRLSRALVLVMSAGLLAGCGGSSGPVEPEFNLAPVTGVVTMNGSPLEGASVTYIPLGESSEKGYYGSSGTTGAEGRFDLFSGSKAGAVPGAYKVVISRFTGPNGEPVKEDPEAGMDMEQLRMQGGLKQSIPPKYSDLEKTELRQSVEATGLNEHKIELTTSS